MEQKEAVEDARKLAIVAGEREQLARENYDKASSEREEMSNEGDKVHNDIVNLKKKIAVMENDLARAKERHQYLQDEICEMTKLEESNKAVWDASVLAKEEANRALQEAQKKLDAMQKSRPATSGPAGVLEAHIDGIIQELQTYQPPKP
jgi:prefoldin subunit 5